MHGDTPADDTDLNDVPDGLMCPITHSIFNEPVVLSSGQTYEKRAIEEHFRHNGYKDPLTNIRLQDRKITPNWVVKKMVEDYVNSRLNVTPNRPDSQEPLQPARGVAVLQADYALALQLQTEYDEETEADSARTDAVNGEEAPRRGHATLLDPGLDELWHALPDEISDSQEPLEQATPRADEISDNEEPLEPASDEETPQADESDLLVLSTWRDTCPALQRVWPAGTTAYDRYQGLHIRDDGRLDELNLNTNYLNLMAIRKQDEEREAARMALLHANPGYVEKRRVLLRYGRRMGYSEKRKLEKELKRLERELTNISLHEQQMERIMPGYTQRRAQLDFEEIRPRSVVSDDDKLTSIPAEIGQLTSLEKLNLANNKLMSLPVEIGQLTSLKELDLFGDQLSLRPAFIRDLKANGCDVKMREMSLDFFAMYRKLRVP